MRGKRPRNNGPAETDSLQFARKGEEKRKMRKRERDVSEGGREKPRVKAVALRSWARFSRWWGNRSMIFGPRRGGF